MLDMLEFLREEGVSERIVTGNRALPGQLARRGPLRRRVPDAPVSLLWQGRLGGGRHRPFVRGKPAAGRSQGHRQKRPGGKPGRGLRPSQLGRVLLHQYGRRHPSGYRHLCQRRCVAAQRPHLPCAEKGGFGILDEINMAKNESLAVLHATLDFRRSIDMPGYERIRPPRRHPLHRHHELRLRRHPGAQ